MDEPSHRVCLYLRERSFQWKSVKEFMINLNSLYTPEIKMITKHFFKYSRWAITIYCGGEEDEIALTSVSGETIWSREPCPGSRMNGPGQWEDNQRIRLLVRMEGRGAFEMAYLFWFVSTSTTWPYIAYQYGANTMLYKRLIILVGSIWFPKAWGNSQTTPSTLFCTNLYKRLYFCKPVFPSVSNI